MQDQVDHWGGYAQFGFYEIAAGGPDPHMRAAGYMSRKESWEERIWRAGCYVGVYNVPAAEVVWERWPWPSVLEHREEFVDWIKEHRKGLPMRRERRCVLNPIKLAQYFLDYAEWASALPDILRGLPDDPKEAYESLWKQASAVRYLGRYVRFKILEFYRRNCDLKIAMPDIRPRGGWSPRRTLGMMFPEKASILDSKDESPSAHQLVNETADEALRRLDQEFGLKLDYYLFEVLLCDYRQCWQGRRQFPGRSQDSELEYRNKMVAQWGDTPTQMFQARSALFPTASRGEIWGWNHVRKELGTVFRDHGYMWSDFLFDYVATTDLAKPVERPGMSDEAIRDIARASLPTRTH